MSSFDALSNDIMADDERASKRQKGMEDRTSPEEARATPEATIDVCAGGDCLLIVSCMAGVPKPVGIRVSSTIGRHSPVLRRLLEDTKDPVIDSFSTLDDSPRIIHLPEDDGDALYLLCNILHLRNDALPTRLAPELLFRFIACAAKYNCFMLVNRATTQWFDHIYTRLWKESSSSADPPLFKLIEASYLLNDAIYFARFTSLYILRQKPETLAELISTEGPRQKLALALLNRQKQARSDLLVDLDLLIDPLSESLSEDAKHYIDCEPGEIPSSHTAKTDCLVDREGSTEYLSALRDANIWPASKWPDTNLQAIVDNVSNFRVPDYDTSEACYWCMNVDDKFARSLELVRSIHKDRLWGICLDCYKAGDGGVNKGECRYEHFKAGSSLRSNASGGG